MAGEKITKKKFSRRDFVVGSGTVLAGGALAVVAPISAPAATAADAVARLSAFKSVSGLRQQELCRLLWLHDSLFYGP